MACCAACEQRVDVGVRVGDAEVDAVRRALAGRPRRRSRSARAGTACRGSASKAALPSAADCVPSGVSVAVRLEVLGVGRPVGALPDRGERALQGRLVLGEEFGCRRHAGDTNAARRLHRSARLAGAQRQVGGDAGDDPRRRLRHRAGAPRSRPVRRPVVGPAAARRPRRDRRDTPRVLPGGRRRRDDRELSGQRRGLRPARAVARARPRSSCATACDWPGSPRPSQRPRTAYVAWWPPPSAPTGRCSPTGRSITATTASPTPSCATSTGRGSRCSLDAGADLLAIETMPVGAGGGRAARRAGRDAVDYPRLAVTVLRRRVDRPVAVRTCRRVFALGRVGATGSSPSASTARRRSTSTELVRRAVAASGKPAVAYPNSGEGWDAVARSWTGAGAVVDAALAREWVAAGATYVGGCCRVGSADIARLVGELR